MNIEFIPKTQLEQYLRLYNLTLEKFVERCSFLEIDGKNYLKTYLGDRLQEVSKEEEEQLLKYFVWWRIYGDLNLEEGEHYKRNFDTLLRACKEANKTGKKIKRIMVI